MAVTATATAALSYLSAIQLLQTEMSFQEKSVWTVMTGFNTKTLKVALNIPSNFLPALGEGSLCTHGFPAVTETKWAETLAAHVQH